jgi:hypothetical protein
MRVSTLLFLFFFFFLFLVASFAMPHFRVVYVCNILSAATANKAHNDDLQRTHLFGLRGAERTLLLKILREIFGVLTAVDQFLLSSHILRCFSSSINLFRKKVLTKSSCREHPRT